VSVLCGGRLRTATWLSDISHDSLRPRPQRWDPFDMHTAVHGWNSDSVFRRRRRSATKFGALVYSSAVSSRFCGTALLQWPALARGFRLQGRRILTAFRIRASSFCDLRSFSKFALELEPLAFARAARRDLRRSPYPSFAAPAVGSPIGSAFRRDGDTSQKRSPVKNFFVFDFGPGSRVLTPRVGSPAPPRVKVTVRCSPLRAP
jgi:hypothetical protein